MEAFGPKIPKYLMYEVEHSAGVRPDLGKIGGLKWSVVRKTLPELGQYPDPRPATHHEKNGLTGTTYSSNSSCASTF